MTALIVVATILWLMGAGSFIVFICNKENRGNGQHILYSFCVAFLSILSALILSIFLSQ